MKTFPVLNAPPGCATTVPFEALSELRAQINHGQSLQRLAERGGLSPKEIWLNVHKIHFGKNTYLRTIKEQDAIDLVNKLNAEGKV